MTMLITDRYCPKCKSTLHKKMVQGGLDLVLCKECGAQESRRIRDWTPVLEVHGKDLVDHPYENAFICDILDYQLTHNRDNDLVGDQISWKRVITAATLYSVATLIKDALLSGKEFSWSDSEEVQWVEVFEMSNALRIDLGKVYFDGEDLAIDDAIDSISKILNTKDKLSFPRKNLFRYSVDELGVKIFMVDI